MYAELAIDLYFIYAIYSSSLLTLRHVLKGEHMESCRTYTDAKPFLSDGGRCKHSLEICAVG